MNFIIKLIKTTHRRLKLQTNKKIPRATKMSNFKCRHRRKKNFYYSKFAFFSKNGICLFNFCKKNLGKSINHYPYPQIKMMIFCPKRGSIWKPWFSSKTKTLTLLTHLISKITKKTNGAYLEWTYKDSRIILNSKFSLAYRRCSPSSPSTSPWRSATCWSTPRTRPLRPLQIFFHGCDLYSLDNESWKS